MNLLCHGKCSPGSTPPTRPQSDCAHQEPLTAAAAGLRAQHLGQLRVSWQEPRTLMV